MLIVVKLKELICKCVITHQRQRREGANYETDALGVKLCPGHAVMPSSCSLLPKSKSGWCTQIMFKKEAI